ncbi:hypothetical protein SAMN05443575_3703 [Jatrophihabitans endophyticus]|uniref:Helix-turn-helix domain-containing protein n=1 Tax=Jatrophihabitans endophyticus TaxID=1206085 RepID=A0A1M5RZU7_9ACTN|nr:hypothetical protein SAMN05443575_3703 [Jatrophihabitans endophyticus]
MSHRVHSVGRRLGDEAIKSLLDDYASGIPTTRLATEYRIGKATVLRLLEDHGITRRRQPMTPDECTEAIQLYRSGLSLAAVGRHFGRDHTVIRDVLKRAGVERRDSHGRA